MNEIEIVNHKQKQKIIEPQEGPQTTFLSTRAEIAIFGGSAGSGKTYSLLLDPLRNIKNKNFGAVIFRRTTKQVRNEGGLWDTARDVYGPFNPTPLEGSLEMKFPQGSKVQFAHMEHENNRYDWDGSQIPYIGFDEIQHFTERQFFYMLARNRSPHGIPCRIRATCNPDPDSWLRRLVDWWIGHDGYPIKERGGKIRYFIRDGDQFIWGDDKFDPMAKSITFIPSLIADNKILLEKDPGYMANLNALQYVERMQKLHGNWDVRPSAGLYFKRHWFEIVETLPTNIIRSVRYWDRASSENVEADRTSGVLMHQSDNGIFYISDDRSFRGSPLKVEQAIKNTAIQDPKNTIIGIEQDPGQAGVADAQNYSRLLCGFNVRLIKVNKDKITRATPLSAQCEAGNVKLVRGVWNEEYLREMESFPEGKHDDRTDASSGAFNLLTNFGEGNFNKNMVPKKRTERMEDQW